MRVRSGQKIPHRSGSLEQCMFVALSFREDYLQNGGWDPVLDELIEHPGKGKTILACLAWNYF